MASRLRPRAFRALRVRDERLTLLWKCLLPTRLASVVGPQLVVDRQDLVHERHLAARKNKLEERAVALIRLWNPIVADQPTPHNRLPDVDAPLHRRLGLRLESTLPVCALLRNNHRVAIEMSQQGREEILVAEGVVIQKQHPAVIANVVENVVL